MGIEKKLYGRTNEGKEVFLFTLKNSGGAAVEITNFGGIIVSILVPDKKGRFDDVSLGYDSLEPYMEPGPYFGAIIGRYANRIENSEFEINGITYHLAANDGKNHLHGGLKGFDKVIWHPQIVQSSEGECLELTYKSADGEENYPGNLDVKVIYTLTEDNAIKIEYFAETDKDTVVNLTNHAYFNLSGHASGDILKHKLKICADFFTAVSPEGLPTGEIREVKGTVMDFTDFKEIGPGLASGDEQIIFGQGYDHNWVLNGEKNTLKKAAELFDPESERRMEVYTTKPGIQFYSGNFLNVTEHVKDGAVYCKRAGLCLETQYFPNSLKHKHFPSPILKAGEKYRHTTIYKFFTA
ncbi:MAG: galactose mutarotase [Clostridia bacterium]|nr:galactose mutarotase [Clostridia bacterium]